MAELWREEMLGKLFEYSQRAGRTGVGRGRRAGRTDPPRAARRDAAPVDRAGAVRLGARFHRHSAAARRGDLLSAQPGRQAAGRRASIPSTRTRPRGASPIPTSRFAAWSSRSMPTSTATCTTCGSIPARSRPARRVLQRRQGQKGKRAAALAHPGRSPRAGPLGRGRRHRRRDRPAAFDHRRHALRHRPSDRAGNDRLPRNGHRDGHRAGKLDRAQKTGRRAGNDEAAGSDLSRRRERRDRPDDHQRHGRAAPGDHQAPAAARFQSERPRPQAAGQLPRNGRPCGRSHRHLPSPAGRPIDVRQGPAQGRALSAGHGSAGDAGPELPTARELSASRARRGSASGATARSAAR